MTTPRFLPTLVLTLSAVAACGSPGDAPQTRPETAPGPVTPAAPLLPPEPATDGPCPYLDESVVEDVNGQLVGAVRISLDQPYPACFFERGDGDEQLRTWVVEAMPDAAVAVVDAAAPVATSDPAELPGGWAGGSQPTGSGAVYAVAKEGTAVVVTTNQPLTIRARRIAEQVIENLGL